MGQKIDYINSIKNPNMGKIYITGGGYVNYPFTNISRESPLGWDEAVWSGELNRDKSFTFTNIDTVEYGTVARCEVSFKYMNIKDYKVLCTIAKQRVCYVTYFNRETGEWVTDQEMAFTGNEISKLFKMGTKYLGVQDVKVTLVATNRDRLSTINSIKTITYNANGGTGTISQQTVKWGGTVTLASSGMTKSGYTLSGWNTQADLNGLNYELGQKITVFGNLTLYAVWEVSQTESF